MAVALTAGLMLPAGSAWAGHRQPEAKPAGHTQPDATPTQARQGNPEYTSSNDARPHGAQSYFWRNTPGAGNDEAFGVTDTYRGDGKHAWGQLINRETGRKIVGIEDGPDQGGEALPLNLREGLKVQVKICVQKGNQREEFCDRENLIA
ncbi:hypothetical protein AB0I84_32850 [Streptomyces spectabilis]|uniref:hypothetical protein n=1 Tax=Streptomyces spectabilis TaxID=68270 RepID=UPI0033F306AF